MKNEFVEKVAAMREAQRQYFKTKSPDWLNKAKSLEREVDKILASLVSKQPALI